MWGACPVSLKVSAGACSEMKTTIPVGRDLASVPIHLPKQHVAKASVCLSVEWGDRSEGHRWEPHSRSQGRQGPQGAALACYLCCGPPGRPGPEAIPAPLRVRTLPLGSRPCPQPVSRTRGPAAPRIRTCCRLSRFCPQDRAPEEEAWLPSQPREGADGTPLLPVQRL
uniref:Uncharacterized protein n=1 Tax=Molossus molossus TaxID=27622 RepID=A0A7J8CZC9_MOLMO|nr:hypothetical protein HJG59_009428 [Molossus molossus]